ncbi:MAG: histidinol-phosphate transaminase [Dehalococcoidales bacterium]|nr:histidinol-phosphate transaminase [Dehalococcoidales bacterium]
MVTELNRNELSYPPPSGVIGAARKGLQGVNRYATAREIAELKSALSGYCGIAEEFIFVTSGVEILLGQLIQLFARKGGIVIIDPTFFIIARVAESLKTGLRKVRLMRPSLDLPMEPLIAEARDAALVVIDSPNNPTGRLLLDRESTRKICESTKGILLVDESYCEFAGFSVIDMVKNYSNLIVTRTMSKAFGLAGLKVGYMAAAEDVLRDLSSLEVALRPTTPSAYATVAALKDIEYMKNNAALVGKERERVSRAASAMGVEVYPSSTNFLLMRTSQTNAARKLKDLEVIVFDPSNQFSSQFIRVSIGTPDENNIFLSALEKVLAME